MQEQMSPRITILFSLFLCELLFCVLLMIITLKYKKDCLREEVKSFVFLQLLYY